VLRYPVLLFIPTFLCLWLAAQAGIAFRKRRPLSDDEREDFGVVQSATLTLLALIIGFSFSMAISRYDQRKNYEEQEANAIGTEYVRAGLLPPAAGDTVRSQLRKYIELRIRFYRTRDEDELEQIDKDTSQLQSQMWATVQSAGLQQPNPVTTLAVAGMNDVLNSQGYTQAAWWNQIPGSAWGFLVLTAICCNVLVGYGSRRDHVAKLLIVLPLVISVSFFLIADIDTPRKGLIHVSPQNLLSVQQSLPGK
jgi:hypothetical protein